jgi:hypothetical protein
MKKPITRKNEMEKAPLTQNDLKDIRCFDPNCKDVHQILYFTQACHPTAGLAVSYDKTNGILRVECGQCERPLADLLIATNMQ